MPIACMDCVKASAPAVISCSCNPRPNASCARLKLSRTNFQALPIRCTCCSRGVNRVGVLIPLTPISQASFRRVTASAPSSNAFLIGLFSANSLSLLVSSPLFISVPSSLNLSFRELASASVSLSPFAFLGAFGFLALAALSPSAVPPPAAPGCCLDSSRKSNCVS